jgi:type II secretory pathway pseudopilin PulG
MIGLAKATGIIRRDRNFFLGAMATNIAAAELPYPQRLEAGRRAGGLVPPNRFYIISSMLLPALSKAVERDADETAQIRAAETGLAIQRYRLAHQGALPDTLADLVPSFIAAVPLDPYDGQPLRFKRLVKGYVVYSIGSDGRDDGGLEADPNNRNKGHDVTFTVEK